MPASRGEIILIMSIISIFMLVMVIFIIIILFFIQKKQKGFASDLNTVKANYEKELYKAQMEIQEQTFQEIAREIHDNVGQLISLAKLGVNALDFDKKEEAMHHTAGISDMLTKATEGLRHMSRSMNADFIKKRGLVMSVEMQVEFLQRSEKFKTVFRAIGETRRINETKEVILFRILQEAVNNSIRHSKATEINITLTYARDTLMMNVHDNGKGFVTQQLNDESPSMNGIYNMQHRAKLIESEFRIESKPETGTTITVITPY